MQSRNSVLTLSATDLSNFLGCRLRTRLDLAVAQGALARPDWRDPHAVLLQKRGEEHEKRYVDSLRAKGLNVAILTKEDPPSRTIDALRTGVDVIVQANLSSN